MEIKNFLIAFFNSKFYEFLYVYFFPLHIF